MDIKHYNNKESVRIFRIIYCFICRVSLLFTALYAMCTRPSDEEKRVVDLLRRQARSVSAAGGDEDGERGQL